MLWSYDAIQEGKDGLVLEVIMNVVAFVPVGLLLGCAFRSMTWWKVMMIGMCLSGTIETMQFYFKRGFTEVDDLMHNTVGCLIGYGVYSIMRYGFGKIGKKSVG